jgi:predicted nucleic acid-binding protein
MDPQAADAGAILMAANTYGLTAYEAIYLQLAVARGADLLTADTALEHAARRAGVMVRGG